MSTEDDEFMDAAQGVEAAEVETESKPVAAEDDAWKMHMPNVFNVFF